MIEARRMRYLMLEAKCMELDIPCLMTAHHAGASRAPPICTLATCSVCSEDSF